MITQPELAVATAGTVPGYWMDDLAATGWQVGDEVEFRRLYGFAALRFVSADRRSFREFDPESELDDTAAFARMVDTWLAPFAVEGLVPELVRVRFTHAGGIGAEQLDVDRDSLKIASAFLADIGALGRRDRLVVDPDHRLTVRLSWFTGNSVDLLVLNRLLSPPDPVVSVQWALTTDVDLSAHANLARRRRLSAAGIRAAASK